MVEEINIYIGLIILLISIFVIIGIADHTIYSRIFYWIFNKVKTLIGNKRKNIELDYDSINKLIKAAGYSYDSWQDIFYSHMDAWQREMGYCRLYDEAAAPLGMIIDCEPIYFEYDNRRWLIEFWKGQYDLVTGGEVGVYTTDGPDLNIPGFFNGTFYNCASNADLLKMSFVLMKNGKVLFRRSDRHWWLTGFKLGEFSEPEELMMKLKITLKNRMMRNEFIKGLKKAGYTEDRIRVFGNTIRLVFDKAYAPQPITRTPETDWVIQRKNQFLCEKYQEITKPYSNFPDKINAVLDQSPEVYQHILNIGRTKQIFEDHERIKNYIKKEV